MTTWPGSSATTTGPSSRRARTRCWPCWRRCWSRSPCADLADPRPAPPGRAGGDGLVQRRRLGRRPIQSQVRPTPAAGQAGPARRVRRRTGACTTAGLRCRGASILEMLIPHDVMGRDVQRWLREFVPKPARAKVPVADPLPDHVDQPVYVWDHKPTVDKGTEAVPLDRRDTERSALRDLLAVLRLGGRGQGPGHRQEPLADARLDAGRRRGARRRRLLPDQGEEAQASKKPKGTARRGRRGRRRRCRGCRG